MSYNEDVRSLKQNKSKLKFNSGRISSPIKFTYHNISLTKDQRELVLSWSRESVQVLDALNEAVNQGCNLSVKYSETNDCFIASVTCMRKEAPNYGSVATGYSSIPDRALATVLWIVIELWGLDKVWPKTLLVEDDW